MADSFPSPTNTAYWKYIINNIVLKWEFINYIQKQVKCHSFEYHLYTKEEIKKLLDLVK